MKLVEKIYELRYLTLDGNLFYFYIQMIKGYLKK